MARVRQPSLSLIHTGILLAIVLLPEFLGAVPVEQHKEEEVTSVSDDVKADAMANLKRLVRNRRNVPVLAVPQFKRLPDFWGWYKHFMDSHNQEGVEDLDRLYMAYLQNKHRSEEGPTFNHYLTHLSEIYKTCADSDDPECISESTSKPKASMVMPSSIKSAAVRLCNPYVDPYCLFPLVSKGAAPEPEPAASKVPAPILTPMLPMPLKSPTGFYHYAPVLEPFLGSDQRAELLRICNPEDVECLQYHLRAAYGYRPASAPAPSYAALKCDPRDPYCMPPLVQKAPTGFYHLMYPSCDPSDPLCVSNVVAPAPLSEESPKEQHCNPLFDADCNPLSATKLSGLTKPVLEYTLKGAPAPPPAPLSCDPRYDPYCILAVAAALRKPPPQIPAHQVRYKLGIRGKTSEGHDCYVHYDKDCTPVKSGYEAKADIKAPVKPFCHPFDPNCGKFASPSGIEASKTGKGGIILPDPDCDPEMDYNCRLRRAEPATEEKAADEPAKEGPVPQSAVPRFEDFLKGVMSQYK
ncbi:hypothetical protein JOB18_041900 [Solea senegalensis]|nr:uncharacterized protein LOC122762077 [Solea senegalensis]KAG7470459.1 hypothetical protein JOB18_041900 [Solea senegalensis]KAG7470461.1 hypothetical protein JOB18_041900 [Solea senegalensis]